jgi:chemotaxis protein methyltransferase CheR
MPIDHDSNIDMADILIVDDEIPNLQLLSELLGREGYQVRPANSPQLAIDSALGQPPALILLDVRMPDMDGFEVCNLLKQDERTRDIPILFISALQDVHDKVRGFEAGGVDFISKPIQEEEVLARVRTHLELRNMRLNLEEMIAKRTAELVENKASLEEAQQLARIGSWSWVVETDTVTWSKTLYEITGLDPKKPPPSYKKNPSLYTAESWERLSQAVASALNDGQPYDLELDMVRPDGLMCHTSTRGRAVKNDDGCGVRLFGTVQDITELKRATAELVKSEAKYRGLVDNSIFGVFTTTLDGRFTFVNDAMAKMFDFESMEQMIAQGSLERWSDLRDRDRMLALLQKHGSVTNFEAESITHTGRKIYVLFSARQIGKDIFGMVMDITERKQAETKLQKANTAIGRLQMQLQAETAYLQEEIKLEHDFESIIGNSPVIQHVLFKVEQVADTDTTALVLGETGTGKELVSRAIHNRSSRQKHPLVKVNCAAMPANLIESELFGHEAGAFTSAQTRQIGRFEVADGTSIFLDEIGELPLELQTKMLQVLQDGEFERLGSSRTIKVNVRVIAASNRDLEAEVRKGRFREDLFYRLNVFPITVPPLRERIEDISLLAEFFMEKVSKRLGKFIELIPASVMNMLRNYPWAGNVRELENVIERAVISSSGPKLRLAEELKPPQNDFPTSLKTMEAVEFDHIVQVLELTDWKVSGKNGAAEILGLKRGTLRARMQKLGIRKL